MGAFPGDNNSYGVAGVLVLDTEGNMIGLDSMA